MFSTIRNVRAIFPPSYIAHARQTQSLASDGIEWPIDERSVIAEDTELWRDYTAVGFNMRGDLQCSAKDSCWD